MSRPIIRKTLSKAPELAPIYEDTVTNVPPRPVTVDMPTHPPVPVKVVEPGVFHVLIRFSQRDERILKIMAASLFTFAFISFMNWIMRLF
uniref:Uncharacterized protein n=1 Tax=Panagrolaimus superbus TaxID=310955 RepID=A0A914XYQ8_9BILA